MVYASLLISGLAKAETTHEDDWDIWVAPYVW